MIVPLTTAAYLGLPKDKTNAAAGLMNFTRNIGMSVGTSAVTTVIARCSQYHQSVLAEYTRSTRFDAATAALASRLDKVGLSVHFAHQQALGRMYGMVIGQAATLSYGDVYWVLATMCALMFLLSFTLAKNETKSGEAAPLH